jgi:hypothetical protein
MGIDPALIETLRGMPRFVRDAAKKVSPEDYSRRDSKGGFSLVEHACHLRDLEQEGYLLRIERILREESPALENFDGGRIATERNYAAQDFGAAIEEFERSRSKALHLLQSVSDEQLGRKARFGSEVITLRDVADMMVQHDVEHREEIAQLAADLSGSPVTP